MLNHQNQYNYYFEIAKEQQLSFCKNILYVNGFFCFTQQKYKETSSGLVVMGRDSWVGYRNLGPNL